LAQQREKRLDHREGADHVGVELELQLFGRKAFQWPGDADPGVVDQGPEGVTDLAGRFGDLVGFGDVHDQRLYAAVLRLRDEFLAVLGLADAREDPEAHAFQLERACPAET
jgi:hypothetical protein